MPRLTLDAFLEDRSAADPVAHGGRRRPFRRSPRPAAQVWRVGAGRDARRTRRSQTGINPDGDRQIALDVLADRIFLEAARRAPVASYASEELAEPVAASIRAGRSRSPSIRSTARRTSISTSPSARSSRSCRCCESNGHGPLASFLQPGTASSPPGLIIYGPQLALVLSLGAGTHIFAYSDAAGDFVLVAEYVARSARRVGVRHQRLELPALGRIRAALFRRLREGRARAARARLQHALARLAGGRGLPHPDARRRVPLSGRQARGLRQRAAAARLRGQSRSPSSSSRPAAARPTASSRSCR